MTRDDSTGPTLPDAPPERPVTVFYDGDCGLCHAAVTFALHRDPRARFAFAPLGGTTWQAVVREGREAPFPLADPPDTMVVDDAGRLLVRSAAVARILRDLDPPWPFLARLLGWTPRALADLGYRFVARVRSRLFRRPDDVCPLVPPELRGRFLP